MGLNESDSMSQSMQKVDERSRALTKNMYCRELRTSEPFARSSVAFLKFLVLFNYVYNNHLFSIFVCSFFNSKIGTG